jgi:hypothetical protein
MVAPLVGVARLTVWAAVKAPGAGAKIGAATCVSLIVYAAALTLLSLSPLLHATARSVLELLTAIGVT